MRECKVNRARTTIHEKLSIEVIWHASAQILEAGTRRYISWYGIQYCMSSIYMYIIQITGGVSHSLLGKKLLKAGGQNRA